MSSSSHKEGHARTVATVPQVWKNNVQGRTAKAIGPCFRTTTRDVSIRGNDVTSVSGALQNLRR
jgi:hypothetical protein